MPIATWLLAMLAPATAKILLALGFSVVSIVGMDIVVSGLKANFLTGLSSVPAVGLQLALLAGFGPAIGIIFGAITTRIVLWKIQNATKILGVNT